MRFSTVFRYYRNLLERLVAEGAGFEPALPFGKHAFQACALSHSATPPIFSDITEPV